MPLPTEYDDQRLTPRYAPFIKPVPIPTAQAFDEPTRCLRVNEQWVGYILGALDVLDQFDVWEGNEEQVFNARQQVLQIKAALMDTEACEQMPALEIEVVDCQIRYRTNPADDWTIAPGTLDGCGGSSGGGESAAGCLPVGTIMMWPSLTPPDGWLLCAAGNYARVDYPDLYDALDPIFHVDADNFIVPNLSGRFPYGAASGAIPVNMSGGLATVTLTENQIPAHTHALENSAGTDYNRTTGGAAQTPTGLGNVAIFASAPYTPLTTLPTGGGASHENMPPYRAVAFIIKALPCEEPTNGVDGEDGASILMDVIDGWIVWRQDKPGSAWINLVPLSELRGLPGADGAPGAPGAPGATGAKGDKGDTGVCDDCGGAYETSVDENDRLQQMCAIAQGLGKYLIDEFISVTNAIDSAIGLGKGVADTASDLLDSIPVIGNVVDELIDLVIDMSEAGDFDDIANCAGDPDNRAKVNCDLYCYLQGLNKTTLNNGDINNAIIDLKNKAYLYPLCGPFLTLWGQFFGLFLATCDTNFLTQKAFLYADERSNDCLIECDQCPPETEWCYTFDFTTSDHDFVAWPNPGTPDRAVYSSGNGWGASTNSAIRDAVLIVSPAFGEREIMSVKWEVTEAPNGNINNWYFKGNDGVGTAVVQNNLSALEYTYNLPPGTNLTFFNLGIEEQSGGTQPQYTGYIHRVTVRGKGTNPFGADNCA